MTADRVRRSTLFTPADDAGMMRTAASTPADALAFDLEDTVPADRLPDARTNLRTVVPDIDADAEVGVRINPVGSAAWIGDVAAAVGAGVDAVLVPKVESPADASAVVDAFRAATAAGDDGDGSPDDGAGDPDDEDGGPDDDRTPPSVRLAVETPTGLLALPAIAARGGDLPAVVGLSFGLADYCRALGAPEPTDAVRERLAFGVATAAAANGLDAFASAHLDIDDEEGLRRIAASACELGFEGMSAIHPDQLPAINEAFTPDPKRVARSRRLVEAYEAADADSIRVEGAFLDEATVGRHRARIERAEAIRDAESDE
jgi:citrate lyase subunit beta/citryl-CoA lyase